MAVAGGELVGGGGGGDVGHVAVGGVALEAGREGVGGDEGAGVGAERTVEEKTEEASSMSLEWV